MLEIAADQTHSSVALANVATTSLARLLNPPVAVALVDLNETTFGQKLRKDAQELAAIFSAGVQGTLVGVNSEHAAASEPTRRSPPTTLAKEMPDSFYDGAILGPDCAYAGTTDLTGLLPFTPENGATKDGLEIVYVNGITTTANTARANAQELADKTYGRVHAIYNGSSGAVWDVAQSISDKIGVGDNPACDTLSSLIVERVLNSQPLRILGDSQGAIITSRALTQAEAQLMDLGWSSAQIERMFKVIEVVTFGGAAWNYPDGPHYRHYINVRDPIARNYGLSLCGLDSEGSEKLDKGVVQPFWMSAINGTLDLVDAQFFVSRHPGRDAEIVRIEKPRSDSWLKEHEFSNYLADCCPFGDCEPTSIEQAADRADFSWPGVWQHSARWLALALVAACAAYDCARFVKRSTSWILSGCSYTLSKSVDAAIWLQRCASKPADALMQRLLPPSEEFSKQSADKSVENPRSRPRLWIFQPAVSNPEPAPSEAEVA